MGISQDRVVVVTGAGKGIGREHALEFARQGARVVVNDVGPVDDTAAMVRDLGGQVLTNQDDISTWDGARSLVRAAIDHFGDLHAVVNNAGILRDRMLVTMSAAEWDDVLRVHLNGTFYVTRHAAGYWRERAKAGDPVPAPRVVNTSSPSGLFGNVGQTNYGAAKAGIAAFTVIAADELARLGVGVNAIAPVALTDMTSGLDVFVDQMRRASEESGFDVGSPANVAPLVVWLASPASEGITGRVFAINGGSLSVVETWVKGPTADRAARWEVEDLDQVLPDLVAKARPNSAMNGRPRS